MSEPHQVEQASNPADKGSVWLKLVMALLVGLVTATVGCLAGIYSLQQPDSWVCVPQRYTVSSQMFQLSNYLTEYKENHGTYPLTLEEMTSQWKYSKGEPLEKAEIEYRIQDVWKNPMVYSSDGETWELLSYGADGKPGGIGLDADIRCTNDTEEQDFAFRNSNLYKHAKPTVAQVLHSGDVCPTLVFSALAGIVCFLFSLYPLFRFRSPKGVIGCTIALMIVTAFFVASHIAALSVANGH